jgi:hypothetical protein
LGAFDLVQSRGPHAPQRDQLKRPDTVLLGPFTGGLTRREADQPAIVVEAVELTVDPTVAKRRIDRLRPRDAFYPG